MFQMEALARNNFLPPWTVQELLRKIQKRLKEYPSSSEQAATKVKDHKTELPRQLTSLAQKTLQKRPISAEAIRKLLSQINFPGVETTASDFDVEEIWRYLEENEDEVQSGLHKELISVSNRPSECTR